MDEQGRAAVLGWQRIVAAEWDRQQATLAGPPKSANGWPVDPPRTERVIPGTNERIQGGVADGPAGDVLTYVAAQVHARVEDLTLAAASGEHDEWGYAPRKIRGSATAISNHASATAIDLNASRHPLGARGTFTQEQTAEIHRILAEVDNVVRWGGDYSSRADEMHFEINASQEEVARVARRLAQGTG
jgi:hypothetical protein